MIYILCVKTKRTRGKYKSYIYTYRDRSKVPLLRTYYYYYYYYINNNETMTLPPGWRKKESKSRKGHFYYISPEGKTQWDKPTEEDTKKRKREDGDSSGNSKKSKADDEKVSVLHLLKKHNKSRRPSSWREKNITKSKEEAIEELKELREAIVSEAKGDDKLREVFEEYAESESDCSSAKRKGDLGPFGRREMQPSFEKASFALKVGELSEIIESNSGVHIILRYK